MFDGGCRTTVAIAVAATTTTATTTAAAVAGAVAGAVVASCPPVIAVVFGTAQYDGWCCQQSNLERR